MVVAAEGQDGKSVVAAIALVGEGSFRSKGMILLYSEYYYVNLVDTNPAFFRERLGDVTTRREKREKNRCVCHSATRSTCYTGRLPGMLASA